MSTIVVQVISSIAAIAAIVAGVMMALATKRFGTGILASGFKTISIGVFLIAIGIVVDAAISFFQVNEGVIAAIILILKNVFLLAGTFVIVIGSKKTADKLESLTK